MLARCSSPTAPLLPPTAPRCPPCSGPCAASPMLTASWVPKELTPTMAAGPCVVPSCAGPRGTLYSASAMSAARFRMRSWKGDWGGVTVGSGVEEVWGEEGQRGRDGRALGAAPGSVQVGGTQV